MTGVELRMNHVKLCVNVDHIATIREARGGIEPDPVRGAEICEEAGAAGITVHLREDRRHIQDRDVYAMKKTVRGKFNLEMALSDDVISVARKVVPAQITIVPEKREELTTEGGLDVKRNFAKIENTVKEFHKLGVLVSLFIEPDLEIVRLSSECGADYIELHTGTYSDAQGEAARHTELEKLIEAGRKALETGIGINAGHGLNYFNTRDVLKIPGLEELNTGHSIISRSVFTGIDRAVRDMIDIIRKPE